MPDRNARVVGTTRNAVGGLTSVTLSCAMCNDPKCQTPVPQSYLDKLEAESLREMERERAPRGVPAYTPTTPDPARLTLGEP